MEPESRSKKPVSRVAVVGGGPAGSFFALYLSHFARLQGLQPEITIYQHRNFDERGNEGCKGCAGLVSLSLMKDMAELNITPPPEVIRKVIDGYTLHSPYANIGFRNPAKNLQIMSVYRGGGPRFSQYEEKISFDGWLLRQAANKGVKIKHEAVARIWTGEDAGLEAAGKRLAYDLVVLAAGVNAPPIPVDGTAYVPPETHIMAMNELSMGEANVRACLGNFAHAFLIPHSGLIFGTLVPKGDFINVSVLSSSKYPVSVKDFLNYDIVKETLSPAYEFACGCRPRAAVKSAYNYYADRFVAIGDAAVTRLYKDGIGTSLVMARAAAQTVIRYGATRHVFKRHYHPRHQKMHRHNIWGHLLFSIIDRTKNSRFFLQTAQRLIGNEQEKKTARRPFTEAAWGILTGSYSYGSVAHKIFNPLSLARIVSALAKEGGEYCTRKKEDGLPRKLYIGGRKVLILGSGFGGAYVLSHLVKSANKDEKLQITMVSDENYFLFTPLLHEVAMGSIETRHIAYPLRRLHWEDRFSFLRATVERIDLAKRQVTTSAGTLDYDCLALALGSIPDKSQLRLESGGSVFTLKTLPDAIKLRNHIIDVFEKAAIENDVVRQRQLLTFVVVGGGYIGVQSVAELRDCIFRHLIRYYKSIDSQLIRIILVEARPKIIERIDRKFSAYIIKQLRKMGIEVRTGSRITRAGEGYVEINGQEIVPTATVIWSTGMLSNPLLAGLGAEVDNLGRIKVNAYEEVPGFSGVYALGDCAHFEDPQTAQPIPPRAHTTVRQARVVAYNILADIRGRDKKAYHYTDSGEIVSIGDAKAVFRFYGLRIYGLPARLIWLAAYSTLVKGRYNRARILTDWLLSMIFGRDITWLNLKDEVSAVKNLGKEGAAHDPHKEDPCSSYGSAAK